MDKVVWLVAGNKGGVGKSVVAKSLVEWLQLHETPIMVVDGDKRTPDVHLAFSNVLTTEQYNLHDECGWQLFSDFLCETKFLGHTVVNLPDGITERAILYCENLAHLAEAYQFALKVLFVINTLPDGLHLFEQLRASFKSVIPVKNLYFGAPDEFAYFDAHFAAAYHAGIIHFPKMTPRIMALTRAAHMPFYQFAQQTGDAPSNFSYAKLVVVNWCERMIEALDDVLLGE